MRTTAKDKDGQGIGVYAGIRRRQTPLPSDVKIDAHYRGTAAELETLTWPMADLRGLIVWRLIKVTGPGKNDREPLNPRARGYSGDGRRTGFEIALEALAALRADWSVPLASPMPRRTEPPSTDSEKLVLEYKRRINEREQIDARLRSAKADAAKIVEDARATATKLVEDAEAKAKGLQREAQEAFAWNMHRITGLADALAVIGIDVAKL